MKDFNSPVAYIDLNNALDEFIATANFSNSFKDIPERFYNIFILLSDRYSAVYETQNVLLHYDIKFISNDLDTSPFRLTGMISSYEELTSCLYKMKISMMDFLDTFLEKLMPSKILRLLYAYEISTKDTITKYNLSSTKNVITDCFRDFLKFFNDKIFYYEKLLRLDKYDQFVHLQEYKSIDGIRLHNLNDTQLDEIIVFYSGLVIYGELKDIKASLKDIFSGKPTVDYLVLRGQKNQLADTFFQLYKNGKVLSENALLYKEWINERFRVLVKGEIELLKPTLIEIFKSKNKPPKSKRILLPKFLTYFK